MVVELVRAVAREHVPVVVRPLVPAHVTAHADMVVKQPVKAPAATMLAKEWLISNRP